MSNWSFDFTSAPLGHYVLRRTGKSKTETQVFQPASVILATKCGVVTRSRWLHEEGRWEGLAKGELPLAWQHWPEHPGMSS